MNTKLYHLASPSDKYLVFAGVSFDTSILELMVCVPVGGILVLVEEKERRGISLLDVLIRRERVNMAFLTPSLLGTLANLDFPFMRTLLFGVEAINEKLFNRLRQRPYRLISVCGSIENTVLSAIWIVNDETSYNNIGYSLEGITCHILSEDLQQVVGGATGELYLNGPQVSPGYTRNRELNEKSFIFYHEERLYRTSDLIRQQPDGSIYFIGRKDTQVKIQGFRIELREITECLDKDPGVKKFHVVVVEQNGRQLLGAYLQPSVPGCFRPEDVRKRLRSGLLYYVVPNL